jgi:general secretion pathway protein N
MRQGPILAVVGGLVFVGVAVATLPASLLVSHLPPDLTVEGVNGTVWNGGADTISLRGAALGSFSWQAEPASLLEGRLDYRIQVTRPDGYVRGRIGATGGGALVGADIELGLPITALNPEFAANAWRGDVKGSIRSVRIETGWPVALTGTFTMSRLQPPGSVLEVGSYALEFDGSATTPTQLVGRVRDVAAPLVVRAQLVVRRDRSYTLEGEVTPRPNAPPEVSNAVAFLGAPDAAGRRAFIITGTF